MPEFAVFTEKMGVREDVPKALLSELFITKDSKNFHEEDGEWRKLKGRIPFLYDLDGEKIKTPKAYYAITAVNTTNDTFTVAGTQKTAIEAVLDGDELRVNGSTGNDALYTIVSIVEDGGNTTITVNEDVTDATADGNIFVGSTPILCYHTYTKLSTQVDYLLLATAYHVWLWSDSTRILTVKFTSGTPASVTEIYMTDHLDCVYFTNNVDKIQWWNTASISNSFAVLGSASGIAIDDQATVYITKAKYIGSYESYLFIGCPTYSSGSDFNNRACWGSRGTGGASIDFVFGGAGDCGYKDFNRDSSVLRGFALKGNDLIVAKGERMVKGWLTTEDVVFQWEEEYLKVGCVSGKSLINDRAGRLYWFASDLSIREIDTPDPISVFVKKTMRDLNPSKLTFVQATYIDEYSELWFALPSQDSDTNDIIFAYKVTTAKSAFFEFPVRAFGKYKRITTFSYDTLPYSIYEEWGAAWLIYNTKVNTVGYKLDLVSDYEGSTFEAHAGIKDDGNDFTGNLVFSTTLTAQKSLHFFKRVNAGMDVVFNRKSEGSFSLKVKRDTEKNWQTLGSVNLEGQRKVQYGDNVIQNGTFTGNANSWTQAQPHVYYGDNALKIRTRVLAGSISISEASYAQQNIPITQGGTRVKLRVNINEIVAGQVQFRAGFLNTDSGETQYVDLQPGLNIVKVDLNDGYTYDKLLIGYYNGDTGADNQDVVLATIDNVELYVNEVALPEDDILWEHIPFNKRARVFYFNTETVDMLEVLGFYFKEITLDGDR